MSLRGMNSTRDTGHTPVLGILAKFPGSADRFLSMLPLNLTDSHTIEEY